MILPEYNPVRLRAPNELTYRHSPSPTQRDLTFEGSIAAMAPAPLDSLYEAALNETLPSNEQIVPYAHGLTGVDLHVNDITT